MPGPIGRTGTAYDFERYAIHDLRRYLKIFEIPKPPESNFREVLLTLPRAEELFKSHENRNLTIVNEPWRKLEFINPIMLSRSLVSMFLDALISTPIKLNERIKFSAPMYSLPQKLSDKFYSHKNCDIEEMKTWLALPLVTAMRVLHIASSNTVPHGFSNPPVDSDDKRFQYFVWSESPHNWGGEEMFPNARLIVAFQTPFILNTQDMREFVGVTSFPPNQGPTNSLPSRYKLWAKIWDTCYSNQCRWFILTSYTQWVFGVFSDTMRTASVSPIYDFNNASPTVLELLIYWLASAMDSPGAFRAPMTIEPIPMDETPVDCDVLNDRLGKFPRLKKASRVPKSLVSDYAWRGQNHEPFDEPNIDLQSAFDGEGSLFSHYPVQDKPDIANPVFQRWIAASQNAKYRKLDEDDFISGHPDAGDLLEDVFNPDLARGEWMI